MWLIISRSTWLTAFSDGHAIAYSFRRQVCPRKPGRRTEIQPAARARDRCFITGSGERPASRDNLLIDGQQLSPAVFILQEGVRQPGRVAARGPGPAAINIGPAALS